MRIAIFTETFLPKLDGIVTVTKLLLEHLRRVDADVMLFAAGERVPFYAGYPVISMPGIPVPMYPELTLALPGTSVFETLQAFDPDLVHVMNPVMSGLRGMQFARRLDKPLIASFHTHLMEMARFYNYGIFEPLLWELHRQVYTRADRVFATSQRMVSDLRAHQFGVVQLWRRGVDVSRFSPDFGTRLMRERLSGGHPERTLLLSVGRLAPEKQVEQIRAVLDSVPNLHLAIVGDGPHRETLERHYAGYPVTFVGYMAGDELSTAYASADVFVFPTSSIETFGLVAAEAMASGVPVVASRVGGMPELIVSGVNGFLFDENDVATMVEQVGQLAANTDWRRKMGRQARESVARLSWEAIMDEFFDHYRTLIAEHQGQLAA